MKLSQLKIDPEFQSKIPPLQFEEEQQLEQNIIAEGRLLNPIITWNGYILDGHTRYRILKKHGFIKFEVEEIQLANKYEALAWICKNQLGRRNLSPERKKFLLGKEYESTKLAVGGQPGNCNKVNRCDQNDHIDSEKRTCERIAVEHGVGPATVRRAEKYSRGIDAAEEAVSGAQEEILTGRIKATDAQIAALPAIPKEERPAILDELRKEKRQTERESAFQTEAGASAAKVCAAETAGTSAERGTRSTGAGDTLPTGGGNRTCQQRTTKFSSEDTGAQAPPLGGGHGTVEGIGGQPVPRPHCKKWFHHAVRVARRSRGFYVPMGHYFPELSGCFNQ